MISKQNRLIGAILLVAGTTIGAGMLALPVTTGRAGFLPSVAIMLVIWLFMMLTAFYFLEVNLRTKGENNLISMVHGTLGKPGEIVAWIFYLLLLYSLMASYLVGCSQILEDFVTTHLTLNVPYWAWPLMIFLFFGFFIYFGTGAADFINRAMMVGLVIAYLGLMAIGLRHINPSFLKYRDWNFVLPSISVVATTFGYHVIIPTLTTYLEHDSRLLRKAIFWGSFIPLLVYLFWQTLAMGVVPATGEGSLTAAQQKGLQVTFYLIQILNNPWVGMILRSFAFFAIVTSLLGVSLSLDDFLSDGLKIKKTRFGRILLILLTYIPPLIFALFYHEGFILALQYAGIFVIVLLALLPILMVWVERYRVKELNASKYRAPGGRLLLAFAFIFALVLLSIEVFT